MYQSELATIDEIIGNTTLKILHVINGLQPGGAEIMLLRLCEELVRHDVQNEVFSLTKADTLKPELEALGVKCHSGNLIELRRYFFDYSPDIVQGWMYHSNLAISLATLCSSASKKCYWSIHHSVDDISREKFTIRSVIRLLGVVSRFPNKTVYVSQVSKQQHEALGYNSKNSVLIPNGYDLNKFRKDKSLRSKFRSEFSISDDRFLVGILGRFHPMKDHEAFLDAAKLFSSNHDKCAFIIAGRGTDCPQIIKWIEDRGLSELVHVLGNRQDVATILNGLDTLATSSSYGEAFPIVIGEAMACETVCCSTDVGDSKWLIGDENLISRPDDHVALSENWLNVAKLSLQNREQLGKKLRNRIEEKFALADIADKYLCMYSSD